MHADSNFKPIMDELMDKCNANVNLALSGEHVQDSEQENWTLQEQLTVNIYHLLR